MRGNKCGACSPVLVWTKGEKHIGHPYHDLPRIPGGKKTWVCWKRESFLERLKEKRGPRQKPEGERQNVKKRLQGGEEEKAVHKCSAAISREKL